MSQQSTRFLVADLGIRADRLVADVCCAGRRTVRRWFEQGLVRVDGHVARASDLPPGGSEVTVEADSSDERPSPLEQTPLNIVHENSHCIVVSKPAGIHCERGRSAASVAGLLEEHFGDRSRIGERATEAGLVHRLDRDTSGVLLAARNAHEYSRLRRAFQEGKSLKHYLAVVAGPVDGPLAIDTPLARRSGRMTAASAHDHALLAETFVEPLERREDWSLVLVTIRSGAMHQVRVHLALEAHPLIGDELYGGPRLPGCTRQGQLLHALRLQVSDELDITVGPPDDFVAALALLRKTVN